MNSDGYVLPDVENLDINSLARLFDDKATSYKLIFFYSILEILRRNFFDASLAIDLQDVNVEMLVHSWYPHTVFNLSFGYQDTITQKLDDLEIRLDKPILEVTQNDKRALREVVSRKLKSDNYQISESKDLRRYVPFRLIRPFFPETRGIKDSKVKQEVARLSRELFCSRKPLYQISEDSRKIYFHPDWANYLRINYPIVHGWTVWNWMSYMQSRNPNTPAIANKIFPPYEERDRMEEQRKYWRLILSKNLNLRCIYSNQVLAAKDFSLDHYLPWSFVAHNNLWNLIPVPGNINSSKSNRIPDEVYLEQFVEIQYYGILKSREYIPERKWKRLLESYLVDLKFQNLEEVMNFSSFKMRYVSQIKPLMALAESQGFEGNWRYRQVS